MIAKLTNAMKKAIENAHVYPPATLLICMVVANYCDGIVTKLGFGFRESEWATKETKFCSQSKVT